MRNYYLLFFLFFIRYIACNAQEIPSIQTDRPDQTECPFITPIGCFQLETGMSYENTANNATEIIAPTVLTRFGITNNFELRLITEFTEQKSLDSKTNGIQPVRIGFKSKILNEKGILPEIAFIGHLQLPKIASKAYQQNYYLPDFRFTMQHTISNKQTFSYNLGAQWGEDIASASFIYTITSGYNISDKVGVYAELYGFCPQFSKPDHRADAGITYLINANNQLDISAGGGISKTAPKNYIALGYSFRFGVR